MTRISVLGAIGATRDGEPIDIGGPTQRRLLATLIAANGEIVSVAGLLDALWRDEPPPSGPMTIQSYVSRLRKALGSNVIVTVSPGYRFDPATVEVDAQVFRDSALNLPDTGEERVDSIRSLLDLWNGPAFEDFDTLEASARSLTEQRLALEEELAALQRDMGDYTNALEAIDRVVSADPLRESAWTSRALILHMAGRQAEAIKTLDEYRTSLVEVGLEPSAGFVEIENTVFGPSPTHQPPIPSIPDEFFGRVEDLETLTASIGTNKLTTVVGPGGMGKTRLVLETLLRRETADPTWVVSLASVSMQSGVLPTILDVLGVESRGDPLAQLITSMQSRRGLLLVDNCEHVIDEVARVVSALASTPVVIVATSREALNVAGEHVVSLGPLNEPNAIELFVERATRVNPSPVKNGAAIAELCRMVDHMPLAIEMAASRTSALTPEQIIEALKTRQDVLSRARRDDNQRHQTLDALVGWSYELLSDAEKLVFQRVSVFAGPFSLEAAIKVAGFGEIANDTVSSHIAALVERSLLLRLSDGTFRVLRVLRSFARTVSEDSGTTSQRHAAFCGDLATSIGEGLATSEELAWIDTAKNATDDMASAIDWCVASGDMDIAARILEGLFDWFYHRQPPALVTWGDRVLEVADSHRVFSIASAWASLAAMKQGDVDRAMEIAATGARASDGPESRFAMFMYGDVACYVGDLDTALAMFDGQLVRASAAGDNIGVIDAVAGESLALSYQGMYERALAVAEGIELTARRTGSPTYIAYADYTLGEALVGSDHDRAVKLFERAIATARTVNNQFIEGMAATALGWANMQVDEYVKAAEALQSGLSVYRRIGAASYVWTATRYLALLAARVGENQLATELMSAAEAAGRRPYGSDEVEWLDVLERISDEPEYRDWVAHGSSLSQSEAADRAANLEIPTPQRR